MELLIVGILTELLQITALIYYKQSSYVKNHLLSDKSALKF